MNTTYVRCALLLLLSCTVLPGCQSESSGVRPGPRLAPEDIQVRMPENSPLSTLPRPSELPSPQPRSASAFTEDDLIRHGSDFNTDLPFGNLAANAGDPVVLNPNWSANPGGLNGLAYCIYDYTVDGYDREPWVCYGWSDPPADSDNCYIALADWNADMWRWFKGSPSGKVVVPNLLPYFNGSHRLLVVVALMGSGPVTLDYVRLGAPSVNAVLGVTPDRGIVPVTATGQASASTIGAGSAVSYDWDWDGDGIAEYSYPDDQASSFVCTAPGVRNVTLRIANTYGESDAATVQLDLAAPWAHSWGGALADIARGIAIDPQTGAVYVVGDSASFGGGAEDLVLLKFSLDGDLAWARSWGGAEQEIARGITLADDGSVIVCGSTQSFGEGSTELLVQQWDSAGTHLWSRIWGAENTDEAFAVQTYGAAIYVAGGHAPSQFDTAGALLKLDAAGNLVWARQTGKDGSDSLRALAIRRVLPSSDERIYITGITRSYNTDTRWEALYAIFENDGEMTYASTFGKPGSEVHGRGIKLSGNLLSYNAYICGTVYNGVQYYPFLVKIGDEPFDLKGPADSEQPYAALTYSSGLIYLVGIRSLGEGSAAFLARISSAGVLEGYETWSRGDDFVSADQIAQISGGALFVGGKCVASDGGGWGLESASFTDSGCTWEVQTEDYSLATGTLGVATAPVLDITDAVLDDGGGGTDALIIARPLL